jgi:Plasmid pRiA4b ORF-3-like protein
VAATVHRLKVTLRSVKPPIWRRIEVESDVTLTELSDLLEAAMGWMGGHLHTFEAAGVTYERPDPDDGISRRARDESEHRLGEVLTAVGAKMRWDYDFGDGRQHGVEVEAIDPIDPAAEYPRCVAGRRACPPEDCGGPWGFQELLETIADPSDPRHEELTEWLPLDYDPGEFDPDDATEEMRMPRPLADDW